MNKQLISITLSLVMLMTMIPYSMMGDTVYGMESQADIVINETYDDIITEEAIEDLQQSISVSADKESPKLQSSSTEYCTSVEEAGQKLREQMVQRVYEPVVYLKTSGDENKDDLHQQVYEAAVTHTGVPTEGDYLAYAWWMRGGYASETTDGADRYLTLEYHFYFNSSAEQEAEVTEYIEGLKEHLDLQGKSDYEKIVRIHAYITANIDYDYEHAENIATATDMTPHSAYGALISKEAVCQGYAILFYRLTLEYGIDTRIIASDDHTWNLVKLDGKYYNLDATWDASFKGAPYRYFLKCDDSFATVEDHMCTDDFKTDAFLAAYPKATGNYDVAEEDNISCEHLTWDSEYTILREATCEKEGQKAIFCAKCSWVKKDITTIPKKPHKYGDWIVWEPTCVEDGIKYKECSCWERIEETLPATGHTKKTSIIPATMSSYGEMETYCSECMETFEWETIDQIDEVKLSASKVTYNGKKWSPSIIVKDSMGSAISLKYYAVSTPSGRKNVGKYTYKITFKDCYKGTKSLSFTINPKGNKISKLSKAKKAFTVKWKKPVARYRKQMTGYQIRYSTSSNMTKAKTVTVKSTKATSKTIKKLKPKKKYYVQIRTYKTVKGVKYYSGWSAKKAVKTR